MTRPESALHVEVLDDEFVITMPGTSHKVTFRKLADGPGLILALLEVLSSGLSGTSSTGFVTLSAFSRGECAGYRRHAVDDLAQVRNEPARSSLKCGRRSR